MTYFFTPSEALSKELLNNLPGMFFRSNYNSGLKMTQITGNCELVTGYKAEELLNNKFISYKMMVHAIDLEQLLQQYCNKLEHHLPSIIEYRITCKNGQIKWVKEIAAGIYDDEGKLLSIEGYIEDITAQKEIFSISSEYYSYQSAINAGSIVSMTDTKGKIYFANELFCKYSKYTREELLGKDHRIVNSGFHAKEFFKELWDTIKAGKIWRGEVKNVAKDGSYYWVDTVISPIYNENNEIVSYLSIRNLITVNKNNEEKIKVTSELNNGILSSINFGLAVISADGIILNINEGWNKITQFSRTGLFKKAIVGSNYQDILQEMINLKNEDAKHIFNGLLKVSVGLLDVYNFEYSIPSNERKLFFHLTITGFTGVKRQVVIRIIDITERKEKEIELQKTAKELSERFNELMQFNYIVSHNLRAPVANILGMASIISMPEISIEDRLICVGHINTATLKLDEVIRDLNVILETRSALNKIKSNVSIKQLLETIIGSLENQMIEAGCDFKWDLDNEADEIYTIKGYLESILYNLINNALKYKSPSRTPEITIFSKTEDNKILISVSDNGIGIDLNKSREKLFGLYQRFNLDVEGKGLGLYMCKTQAETLGGSIEVASELDKGTTFTLTLPLN